MLMTARFVPVPVMQIGVMRVLVYQRRVPVWMTVRLAQRVSRLMRVPMVLVVSVPVLVFQCLVDVLVLVPLGHRAGMVVLVVIVVDMAVFVRKRFVQMFVLMSFGEM